jgi:LPS sulfotransferase NodH
MAHDLIQRFKSAGRILFKGQTTTVKREVPAITPEEVEEARRFFSLEKFFIFGHARSGTTLLTRLVRLHPQVHCNYQAHFFTRPPFLESLVASEEIEQWLARHSNRWNRGQDLSPVVLRAAADFILERDAHLAGKGSPGCVVGDKSPNSLQDGEAVQRMVKVYPDARLVFIVRDGRDAIVSHRFQTFIDRPHQLSSQGQKIRQSFIDQPEPFLAGQRSLFTEEEMHEAASGWANNVLETDQAARSLLGKQYFSLKYEELTAQSWETLSKVWGFLGVDPQVKGLRASLENEMRRNPDAAWQQRKSAEIATSIQKGQRGTWRELFTSRDRQIFKQAAGEILIDWGYETNLDW